MVVAAGRCSMSTAIAARVGGSGLPVAEGGPSCGTHAVFDRRAISARAASSRLSLTDHCDRLCEWLRRRATRLQRRDDEGARTPTLTLFGGLPLPRPDQ